MVSAQLLMLFIVVAGSCTALSCSASKSGVPAFDRKTSYDYLVRQVSFGPRVPGTQAHDAAREWIVSELRQQTPYVSIQQFKGVYGGAEAEMKNILASFYLDKKERVLLCAHWDSRHHADKDPDPANHLKPVPGANDGASGVAVLLEIAECLARAEPSVGVDIVLFDGEDGGDYGNESSWILGSRHFARTMPLSYRPKYAILLDMIGDKELELTSEVNSMEAAPKLWKKITEYCILSHIPISPVQNALLDDHVPLLERGIQTVDIIDFKYPYWHTVSDTSDKCSPESLGKIGELVLKVIYGE